MEWLALPLSLVGMALLFNGFPTINIGTKKCDCKKCRHDD